jgi:CBS domain containing-hemolysin-like protein
VLTLLVLVVTEIIPKTIGAVYASQLAGPVGRAVAVLITVLAPVLAMTRKLTGLLVHKKKPRVTRAEIAALVASAFRQGTVEQNQKRLFENVLELEDVRVSDLMTPRTVVSMLPAAATFAEFLSARGERTFSRIPLYGASREEVSGYVVQREVLDAIACGADPNTSLATKARDVWYLLDVATFGSALGQFLKRREQVAMVVDEHGAVVGLVTLEDLLETLLGSEIVDETDRTVDMRALAMQIRDQRLEKLRERRALLRLAVIGQGALQFPTRAWHAYRW